MIDLLRCMTKQFVNKTKLSFTIFVSTLFLLLISCSSEETPNDTKFKTGVYLVRNDPAGAGLYSEPEQRFYYLDTVPILDINDYKEVSASVSTGKNLLNVVLTENGTKKISEATEKNIGSQIGFVINHVLVAAPLVTQKISNSSVLIDGNFSEAYMFECYKLIKSEIENTNQ